MIVSLLHYIQKISAHTQSPLLSGKKIHYVYMYTVYIWFSLEDLVCTILSIWRAKNTRRRCNLKGVTLLAHWLLITATPFYICSTHQSIVCLQNKCSTMHWIDRLYSSPSRLSADRLVQVSNSPLVGWWNLWASNSLSSPNHKIIRAANQAPIFISVWIYLSCVMLISW